MLSFLWVVAPDMQRGLVLLAFAGCQPQTQEKRDLYLRHQSLLWLDVRRMGCNASLGLCKGLESNPSNRDFVFSSTQTDPDCISLLEVDAHVERTSRMAARMV